MAKHVGQGSAEFEGPSDAVLAAGESSDRTLSRAARQSAANDNKRPSAPLLQIALVALAAAAAAAMIFAILH